ncbi:MAG: hypothetical protein IPJ42_17940 [Betaproteobacteria bacterium]|nr:hypothetical protein [Betaproteobacteria bacterium]
MDAQVLDDLASPSSAGAQCTVPHNLTLIRLLQERQPSCLQVACFDTASSPRAA